MILEYIFFALIVASILTFFAGKFSGGFARIVALLVSIGVILYSALEFYKGYTGGYISTYSITLSSGSGFYFSLGLNGFTDILIILASIITLIALFVSKEGNNIYYGLIMLTEVGTFGLLLSTDLFFFYVFWEIVLVPVYFLIGLYGGPRKDSVSLKFFVYTHIGSVFILLSIFTLYSFYYSEKGILTMQISSLLNPVFFSSMPYFYQIFVIAGFMIGFLVKLPSFPLHSWLPDSYETASYPVTVILAGALSVMGGYGLFGILYNIYADIPVYIMWLFIYLGIISLIYFSLSAMFQTNLKRMMAYASASSMGFVMISFGSGMISTGINSTIDLAGGMYQIFVHGLIVALIFSMLYYIKKYTGHETTYGLGGIYREAPLMSTLLLGGLLASLGLPGLAGFVAEFSIIAGSFQAIGALVFFVIFAMIITASYHIWAAQRTLYGPYNEKLGRIRDLSRTELSAMLSIFIVILILGIFPRIVFPLITGYIGGF
jgi:NADH-quinone oxidoreductase subunit M